ncbi:MAG: HNH endonuclease [Promethearchaeota archaeon]
MLEEYKENLQLIKNNLHNEDKLNEIHEFILSKSGIIQSYLEDIGYKVDNNFLSKALNFTSIPSYFFALSTKQETIVDIYFSKPITILAQYIDRYRKYKDVNNIYLQTGSILELEKILIKNIYEQVLKNPDLYHSSSRSISNSRKRAVKIRDQYQCQLCQKIFEEDNLVIDHIFPFSLGGSNEKINLMSLCKKCNDDKGKRLDYYRSEEGRIKLEENIQSFVRDLLIIQNFGKWLKRAGNARGNT